MKSKLSSCTGILGKLFGHKFDHIYDVERRPVESKDVERSLAAITNHNFWNFMNQMDPKVIPTERIIKSYRHSICKRCGLTLKDELPFL